MLLLILLAGCRLTEKPDTADAPASSDASGDCPSLCLDMEGSVESILLGVDQVLSRPEYEAVCAGAGGLDCEACYALIQDQFLTAHGVCSDCGLGLTIDAMRTCLQDPSDMSDQEAQDLLDHCLAECDAYGL